MYAVIVNARLDPDRTQEAADELSAEVVPQTKAAPGFVRGTWCGDDHSGHALILFDSQEHAEQMASSIGAPPGSSVQIESVRTYQVHADA